MVFLCVLWNILWVYDVFKGRECFKSFDDGGEINLWDVGRVGSCVKLFVYSIGCDVE